MKLVGWVLFFLFTFCGYSFSFDYYIVTDAGQFKARIEQSYPNHMGTYTDVYGATIRRMTNESANVYPNYTARTSTIENSDGTMFAVNSLARAGSSWEIFTTADGIYRGTLKSFVGGTDSAYDHFVWSNDTPNMGYLFAKSKSPYDTYPGKLWKITINTKTWQASGEVLYTYLPEHLPSCPEGTSLGGVTNHDEGPTSWDGRYWATRMTCSDCTSENHTSVALLVDRDMYGFEKPGIKGYVRIGDRVAYCLGISPGGNYLFWRATGMKVKAISTATMIGEIAEESAKIINLSGLQAHFSLGYDDLGNEVYIAPRQAGSGYDGHNSYAYWRFNQPSTGVTFLPWWMWRPTQYGGAFGAVHSVPAGINPGPRNWVAILPTGSATDYPECGNEYRGTSTITYAHLSATNKKAFRVAHARNEGIGYVGELKAGASRDGTKMYFQSDWCNTQTIQLFHAELPAKWWTEVIDYVPPLKDSAPPSPPKGVKVIK